MRITIHTKLLRMYGSASKDKSMLFIDAVHPTQATKISHSWYELDKIKYLKQHLLQK